MPTVIQSPVGGFGQVFIDGNGNPLSGGKLYSYAAGTTTPLATYTAIDGLTTNTDPIILLSSGVVPSGVWLISGSAYKFVLQNSAGALIGTYDNVEGLPTSFVSSVNGRGGAVTLTLADVNTAIIGGALAAANGAALLSLTAANLVGQVGIPNGGTGQATANAGFNALSPLTTLGDTLYGAAAGVATRLPGNTTAAKQVLSQTGTGSASAIPAWSALVAGDIPTISGSQVSGGTFGAVNASALTSLAAANITGSNTLPDGVLSTNVPLLGASNTYTGLTTTINQPVATSGTPKGFVFNAGAHTTIANSEYNPIFLNMGVTTQFAGSGGAIALNRGVRIAAQTLSAAAAQTITTPITLAVDGPPSQGTNVTFGQPWIATFGTPTVPTGSYSNSIAVFSTIKASVVVRNSTAAVEGALEATSSNIQIGSKSNSPVQLISNNALVATITSGGLTVNPATSSLGTTNVFVVTAPAVTSVGGESSDVIFNLSRTVPFFTTIPATQRAILVQPPTYSSLSGSQTITDAATIAISGAPAAGANITITNAHTLWVQAGQTSLDGGVRVGSGGTVLTQQKVYSPTITPASVGALSVSGCVQTFTVTGLAVTDKIVYNQGTAYANGVGHSSARCSAADTLELTFYNNTAGALTPASGTARILATRS